MEKIERDHHGGFSSLRPFGLFQYSNETPKCFLVLELFNIFILVDHMGCIHKGMGFVKGYHVDVNGDNVDGEYYWQTFWYFLHLGCFTIKA